MISTSHGPNKASALALHLGGGDDRVDHHARGLRQGDRTGDQVDRPAGFLRRCRQGEAHLARRRVADEANRVEELARRTGGDEAAEGQGGLKMADERTADERMADRPMKPMAARDDTLAEERGGNNPFRARDRARASKGDRRKVRPAR
jgi:hypothetical protein